MDIDDLPSLKLSAWQGCPNGGSSIPVGKVWETAWETVSKSGLQRLQYRHVTHDVSCHFSSLGSPRSSTEAEVHRDLKPLNLLLTKHLEVRCLTMTHEVTDNSYNVHEPRSKCQD